MSTSGWASGLPFAPMSRATFLQSPSSQRSSYEPINSLRNVYELLEFTFFKGNLRKIITTSKDFFLLGEDKVLPVKYCTISIEKDELRLDFTAVPASENSWE